MYEQVFGLFVICELLKYKIFRVLSVDREHHDVESKQELFLQFRSVVEKLHTSA